MLPKSQCLDAGRELIAKLMKALAFPEDTVIYIIEVLKFIMTIALILATGVVLLMVG